MDQHPNGLGRLGLGRCLLMAMAVSGSLTCRERPADTVETKIGAVTGTITISGAISDANGLPLGGVTVHLDGTSQAVVVESNGSYSFAGLRTGSYSVRLTLNGCSFVPDVVNLNNLTTNAIQNFGGSGTGCGGTPSVNTGATSGAFAISGHVRDATGKPVVGAQIALSGTTSALRFSDHTGGYTFHVNSGSYSLAASGACTITPANVALNNLTSNRTQDFTAGSGACVTSGTSHVVGTGEMLVFNQSGAEVGVTLAHIEQYADAPHAAARLQAIAGELPNGVVRNLTIAGLPAIELQGRVPVPGDADGESVGPVGPGLEDHISLTTAIAVGSSVVRFSQLADDDISPAAVNSFFVSNRNFTPDEMSALHGAPLPVLARAPVPAPPPRPSLALSTGGSVTQGAGEIAIAVSDSTNAVVYASNPGTISVSFDNGNTFTQSKIVRNAGTSGTHGDPSMAVGAPNAGGQTFYYTQLFGSGTVPLPPDGTTTHATDKVVLFNSVDNGLTFKQTANVPVDCSVDTDSNGFATCTVPDQEQLVADRRFQNSQGGDNVYLAWNHIGANLQAVGVTCSSDGGNTWRTTPDISTLIGAYFPRPTVGADGSLLISYTLLTYVCVGNGSNNCSGNGDCCSGSCQNGSCVSPAGVSHGYATKYQESLWVEKFSSCDSGLVPQPGFPVKVAANANLPQELSGVDRMPSFGQYMLAADDTDPNKNRIFIDWLDEVGTNPALIANDQTPALANDVIHIAESTNGGLTWKVAPFPIDTVQTGHRFHPWMCMSNGVGYVAWYDRRDATVAATDLTAYYEASFADPTNSGTPTFGAEINVSGGSAFDDPECLTGFPYSNSNSFSVGSSSPDEETLCTDLPSGTVPAGSCEATCAAGATPPCGSLVGCDFRPGAPDCPNAGEVCTITGNGEPKFGDYNGAACVGGQLFMAWAAAVPPVGVCLPWGGPCTSSTPCCSGGVCLPTGVCAPVSGIICTANGTSCTTNGGCCSQRCIGGTCEPPLTVFASSTASVPTTSCETDPNPAVSVSDVFTRDTGFPDGGGVSYGTQQCPNQYLVDVDLTSTLQGRDLFVSGRWSTTLPATPCDEKAIMTVFTFDGSNWSVWDVVPYTGVLEGSVCHEEAQSHINPDSVGLGGTIIPASSGFTRARIAVSATENGNLVPVFVAGD